MTNLRFPYTVQVKRVETTEVKTTEIKTAKEHDDKAFDNWFQNYLVHKTASCLDRDILRWAKPILKVGFLEQEKNINEPLEFKGSKRYLKLEEEYEKLLELAELGHCLALQCIAWAKDKNLSTEKSVEENIVKKYEALLAENEELKKKVELKVVGSLEGLFRQPREIFK